MLSEARGGLGAERRALLFLFFLRRGRKRRGRRISKGDSPGFCYFTNRKKEEEGSFLSSSTFSHRGWKGLGTLCPARFPINSPRRNGKKKKKRGGSRAQLGGKKKARRGSEFEFLVSLAKKKKRKIRKEEKPFLAISAARAEKRKRESRA